jgi:tetratricopeptide (TPR) repeat protein
MKRTSILFIMMVSMILGIMIGCAPPPQIEEAVVLTPEQQKAFEDSLRAEREKELKIIRSFAYSHYNNKNYVDAAKYYSELLEKDLDHKYNDYGKWAQCYVQMNVSVDSVKMVYQRGLDAFPEDGYLHASLGHILRTQGLLAEAAAEYEAAAKYKPEELDYQKTLAELYVRLDEPLKAINLYRQILEQEPDNRIVAETLAGLVKTNLSPEEYIASLESAVQQFPDDLNKKYDLAKAYSNQGQNLQALDQLNVITRAEPANVRALKLTGEVQQNLRNYNAAIAAYKKILDIQADADVMVELSIVYRELGNWVQARTYARRALAERSNMGAAYVAQAAIYEYAADRKTQGKSPKYEDKLVFLISYGLYQQAVNSGDYSVLDQARTHLNFLKESQLIPQYSDWFMHQKERDPTVNEAYSWINLSWPEVRYIDTYLDKLSQK